MVDVLGHTWNQAGPDQVVGRHYDVDPNMRSSWWATREEDGILLFEVHGMIDVPPDELSDEQAEKLKRQGHMRFHELTDVETGEESEDYVVYLKHTAVRRFYFDGGPMQGIAHQVRPDIDYEMPNWYRQILQGQNNPPLFSSKIITSVGAL